jgi:hypothetical protein
MLSLPDQGLVDKKFYIIKKKSSLKFLILLDILKFEIIKLIKRTAFNNRLYFTNNLHLISFLQINKNKTKI